MPPLRLGVIGCGHVAQAVHINLLTQLPDVELVALAEVDPGRREAAKNLVPTAVALADYRDLLALPEIAAVVICVPTALHAEVAVAALQQGKHIYLEKPLASSCEEGQQVLAAWQDAGVVGMIGFNYRFNALHLAARDYLQSGRIGELVAVRSIFSTTAQMLPVWKQRRQTGGGVLLDLASHHLDLVHFLFGQAILGVFAESRSQASEADSATLQLRLADGLLVQSFFSINAVEEDRFEIYGQKGKLTVDRYLALQPEITAPRLELARLKRLAKSLGAASRVPYLLEKYRSPQHEPSYRVALERFVAAVRTNQPATPDLWDGYRSLAIVEAAEASASSGQVVAPQMANEEQSRPERTVSRTERSNRS